MASSTPAPLRAPRRLGVAAPAPAPHFQATDYRAREGSVPLVRGVLDPAQPMDSEPFPEDSTQSLI